MFRAFDNIVPVGLKPGATGSTWRRPVRSSPARGRQDRYVHPEVVDGHGRRSRWSAAGRCGAGTWCHAVRSGPGNLATRWSGRKPSDAEYRSVTSGQRRRHLYGNRRWAEPALLVRDHQEHGIRRHLGRGDLEDRGHLLTVLTRTKNPINGPRILQTHGQASADRTRSCTRARRGSRWSPFDTALTRPLATSPVASRRTSFWAKGERSSADPVVPASRSLMGDALIAAEVCLWDEHVAVCSRVIGGGKTAVANTRISSSSRMTAAGCRRQSRAGRLRPDRPRPTGSHGRPRAGRSPAIPSLTSAAGNQIASSLRQ